MAEALPLLFALLLAAAPHRTASVGARSRAEPRQGRLAARRTLSASLDGRVRKKRGNRGMCTSRRQTRAREQEDARMLGVSGVVSERQQP